MQFLKKLAGHQGRHKYQQILSGESKDLEDEQTSHKGVDKRELVLKNPLKLSHLTTLDSKA